MLNTDVVCNRRRWFATVNYSSRVWRICRRHHASVKWKGCPPDHRWQKSLVRRKPSRSSGRRRRDGGWYAWTGVWWPRRRLVDYDRVGVDGQRVVALPHGRASLTLVVHRQRCRRRHEDVVVSRDNGWRRWRRVMIKTVGDQVGLSTTRRAVLTQLRHYTFTPTQFLNGQLNGL